MVFSGPTVIEAVWKIEAIRLIAPIARITHDIGIAELLGLRVSRSDLTLFDYPGFRGIDAGIRAAKGEFSARAAQRTLKLPRDRRTSACCAGASYSTRSQLSSGVGCPTLSGYATSQNRQSGHAAALAGPHVPR